MRTITHLAVGMWVMLAACSDGAASKVASIGASYNAAATLPAESPFRKQPAGTVLNFFQWYRSNVKQLKKIDLVDKITVDTTSYYAVNFTATEKYLAALQKSGFVSDQYISYWRAYFNKCDNDLHKTPQNTGIAKGFDIDFVMLAKEYEEDLKTIELSTVNAEKIDNDQGYITIGLPTAGRLRVSIEKQGDKWMINGIKDMRSALDQPQND
jgi:hypothetical protein